MTLSINLTTLPNVMIVKLSGRLSIIERKFAENFNALAIEPDCLYVLDLTDLFYIDASGLGRLVSFCQAIQKRGGCLVVVAPTERIMQLIKITKLTRIFEVIDAPVSSFLKHASYDIQNAASEEEYLRCPA